ncbi:hypothetical protein [Rhizobium leguminosarum]|uniref:hypothetical protein n=1 Tax=Rhizobium leguminosarum TaxID=384 RepID=UPI001C98A9F7|nr:hypothetical protein [Rhizobium leguminosarum]MBY5560567.1 hypothetical protein [Rhizobium leguminosarum]MBY5708911.1 hypothetical protein [Rhizobium leguminosarum]
MNKLFLVLPITLLACFNHARADCDAETIRAFSDVFKEGVKHTISKQVFDKVCSNSASTSGINVSVPIEGVPVSFGASSKSARSACATRTLQYFEDYARTVLVLRASDAVKLDLVRECFGGVGLVALENTGGITITAYGVPYGEDPVRVSDFTWIPKSGIKPTNNPLCKESVVSRNGTIATFERETLRDVTFTLNTKAGAGAAQVTTPGVEIVPMKWSHRIIGKDRWGYTVFQCQVQIGDSKLQNVGGAQNAKLIGLDGLSMSDWRNATCIGQYGPVLRFMPGSSNPINTPDRWEMSDVNGADPAQWSCTRNGKTMPHPLVCLAKKNCSNPLTKKAYCIQAFQDHGRDDDENTRDLSATAMHLTPEESKREWDTLKAAPEMQTGLD